MSFTEPPFWARQRYGRVFPHAVSLLVQPAVTVVSSSVANPTVITTLTPHYYVTGDTVTVASHTGSTPAVDGSRVVTVLSSTTFSVPVNVTVAGTGGTVTRTIPVEPLTLTEGKLRAELSWATDAARDVLMNGFIAAARSKVEQDTGLALLSQVRDVYYDAIAGDVTLPALSQPLQAVSFVKSTDTSDVLNTLAASNYVVDTVSGRIGLALGGSWPSDLRPFQPIVVRIVAGWATVADIPPLLIHAVGLLTAHYATQGRDLTTSGTIITTTPYGYEDAIAPYVSVSLV